MKPGLILLCLLVAITVAGCARRETAVEAGIRTHTLLVGNGSEPVSLDPHLAKGTTDQCILASLLEGLTVLDEETAQPVPGVAERWEVSPDGLVYTFHLRANACWSNGDPVTARDFAFAFQRILTPKLAAHYVYMLWPIKNAKAFNRGQLTDFSAVGIATPDDGTLRLTLEHPTPYLPALAAHTTWLPVHRETVGKFGAVDDRTTTWARPGSYVGNGAFTLVEWRPNVRVVVQKNPHYWDAARNRIERIVFFPTEAADVEERDFRAGQVHVTNTVPASRIAHYRADVPSLLRLDPLMASVYLSFNVTRPPLNDPKVRRALALAVDRRAIVERLFAGSRRPAGCLTPPNCAGYTARAVVPTDFIAARRLLTEAGFPEGRGLPPLEIQTLSSFEHPKMLEIIQEQWRRELGVESTIAQKESGTFFQNQQMLDYSVAVNGWVADFADPANFLEILLSDGGNNWTGWKNADYDRLLAEAARAPDTPHRLERYQEAEALLLREAPIAPLYFNAQSYLIHPAVRGWVPSQLLVRRYQRVWLAK